MNDLFLLAILILHWVADFVCQTHWQATNKSSNNNALFEHVRTYAMIMYLVTIPILGWNSLLFWIITMIAHFITDYFTSRWVKYYFDKKNFHNGFVVIGLDQILHYLQLYFTIKLLL